jgi:hypothetical protein
VQLRFATGLTSEEYVKQEAWRSATLSSCPLHPKGGCGLARHTPYERVEPPGAWVARSYCEKGHTTFSLLPDCLASRLSSTLREVEQVVVKVEQATSLEAASEEVRRHEVLLPGAVRWVARRARLVHAVLTSVIGLLPALLAGCEPTILCFRARLGVEHVLPKLRERVAAHLAHLPPPVGFGPRPVPRNRGLERLQQETGAEPPC